MHYNLTADDYDVEIGELVEQYRASSASKVFGFVAVYRHAASGGKWEAVIHVDARFSGDLVHESLARDGRHSIYTITGCGSDLCEALRNARNHFVASAPVAIAKGA